jgi:hypothetical protein
MHESALNARRIRPYEILYNALIRCSNIRKIEKAISYEEFLSFTKIDKCHYCLSPIIWKKHSSNTYNLDRKDNNVGYISGNLVVCCYKCNKGKREIFTYEEWYGMTKYFRDLNL